MRHHGLAAVPFIALTLALAGCGHQTTAAHSELPPLAVTVATVAEHDIGGTTSASGRLVPREEVGIAADLSGYRIAQVMVEEGAVVRRDQVLAQLDESLLRSQIEQQRAALSQQQINAEQASEQATRVRGLDGQGVISDEAIRNRRIGARAAQASVAVTRAQLADLLVRRAHLAIRAPFDGVVLERVARPGDTSSSGTTLFRLARGSLIELYAQMTEADVAHIALCDPAEVTLGSGKRLAGSVRLIGERVDPQTGLVTVRIALPRDPELRQGGFAEARFTRVTHALAVPEAAVQFDADGASVRTVDNDSRIHRLSVRTGARAGGFVELREGPPMGTRVAIKGAAFVLDNDRVRVAAEQPGQPTKQVAAR